MASPSRRNRTRSSSFWRAQLVTWILVSFLIIIAGRVLWLQWINPAPLIIESERRLVRSQALPAYRGAILDRHGSFLAVTLPAAAIVVNPKQLLTQYTPATQVTTYQRLSKILDLPVQAIQKTIHTYATRQSLYLKRQIEPYIAEAVGHMRLPAVSLTKESRRFYPSSASTAPLLGLTNIDNEGIEGLEKTLNHLLTGHPGKRVYLKDLKGRPVEDRSEIPRTPGSPISLTIDERLQTAGYHALLATVQKHGAQSGCLILVDIPSGDVLCMVNVPSCNPNRRNHFSLSEALQNRAVTTPYEPGSTIKPFAILAALEAKVVTPKTLLETSPGELYIGSHVIKDVRNYGTLSVEDILKKSSNVGMSKIAHRLPPAALQEFYTRVGFGRKTSLPCPNECPGRVPSSSKPSSLEQAVLSFGYGLSVTPVQLAQAYSTLGRLGLFRPLNLLKKDASIQPLPVKRHYQSSCAKAVLHMLELVAQPGGTGIRAAIPGYRTAVKTGTSEKSINGRYHSNRHVSYTVGVAPVSDPRFCLVVVIDDPQRAGYFGGLVAAPLFSEVMGMALRLYSIPPDRQE